MLRYDKATITSTAIPITIVTVYRKTQKVDNDNDSDIDNDNDNDNGGKNDAKSRHSYFSWIESSTRQPARVHTFKYNTRRFPGINTYVFQALAVDEDYCVIGIGGTLLFIVEFEPLTRRVDLHLTEQRPTYFINLASFLAQRS